MDRDVRMGGLDRRHALGRRDQVDELDPDRRDGAPALEDVDGGGGAPAGREHRVEDQAQVDGRRVGQLVVVLDRAERALVAEQAEMPDLGGRHELEHRVDHAEAGAQDRDEADALAELARVHLLHRRRDVERADVRRRRGPRTRAAKTARGRPRGTSWARSSSSRRTASLCRTAGWVETCRVSAMSSPADGSAAAPADERPLARRGPARLPAFGHDLDGPLHERLTLGVEIAERLERRLHEVGAVRTRSALSGVSVRRRAAPMPCAATRPGPSRRCPPARARPMGSPRSSPMSRGPDGAASPDCRTATAVAARGWLLARPR